MNTYGDEQDYLNFRETYYHDTILERDAKGFVTTQPEQAALVKYFDHLLRRAYMHGKAGVQNKITTALGIRGVTHG